MPTKSTLLTPTEINKLKVKYKKYLSTVNNPYIDAFYRLPECTISIYTSGKVVIQGADIDFMGTYTKPSFSPHAGSDEVGTGDYFGPVVVAACYVDDEHYTLIKDLGIQDSKAIDDAMIQKIAPKLMELLPYSVLIVQNAKYNQIQKANNLNAIKAKLHNQAYKHLIAKLKFTPELNVIDQFTPAANYFKYLNDEQDVFKPLRFETKAENKYLAVACASIIARDRFLAVWKQMEEQYSFTFPKGSGALVDQAAQRFVDQYGFEKLHEVAKLHFKNTQKMER